MSKSTRSSQKVALVFGSEPLSLTQKVFQTISSILNDVILVSTLTSLDEILNKISVVPTVILGIHSKEGINIVDLIDSCRALWSLKIPIIIITTE